MKVKVEYRGHVLIPIDIQIKLWGYFTTGDVLEPDALRAEHPRDVRWDKTARDIASSFIKTRDGAMTRVPDWWALSFLPTDLRQQALNEFMNTDTEGEPDGH